jgi:hypothetical protein
MGAAMRPVLVPLKFMGERNPRCVFCRSPGPLTKEHAIARWIGDVLEDMEPGLARLRWSAHYTAGGLVERDRQHPVGEASVVVRAVCEHCNGGWMSSLEGRVKPWMGRMIRGEPVVLDVNQQVELAAWASKTVMALEFHEPTTVIARSEDRDVVRIDGRPPHHHVVRVAYRKQYREALLLHTLVARSGDAPDDKPDAFGVLMAIGHLLVQVWGGHGADTGEPLSRYGTKIDKAVMVWPPVPNKVEWPPALSIPDEGFDAFAREVLPSGTDSPDLAAWRTSQLQTPSSGIPPPEE